MLELVAISLYVILLISQKILNAHVSLLCGDSVYSSMFTAVKLERKKNSFDYAYPKSQYRDFWGGIPTPGHFFVHVVVEEFVT